MGTDEGREDGEVVLELFALLSACHLVFAVANAAHKRFLSSAHVVCVFECRNSQTRALSFFRK